MPKRTVYRNIPAIDSVVLALGSCSLFPSLLKLPPFFSSVCSVPSSTLIRVTALPLAT
ncbi:hypothetical protein Hanom_Chr03g00253711 [Helianthus anomalus]